MRTAARKWQGDLLSRLPVSSVAADYPLLLTPANSQLIAAGESRVQGTSIVPETRITRIQLYRTQVRIVGRGPVPFIILLEFADAGMRFRRVRAQDRLPARRRFARFQ